MFQRAQGCVAKKKRVVTCYKVILLRRLVLTLLGTLGPVLVLAPERLAHPAPWLLFVAALVLQVTNPKVSTHDAVRGNEDGGSAALILLAGNLIVLVPVIEFSLRPTVRPLPWSAPLLAGTALMWAGVLFRVWAISTLGAFFTGVVKTSDDQRLIEGGPYRWVRHPSYTGTLIAFLGEAVLFESWWGAALTLLAMVPIYGYRISKEEKALMLRFGELFERYRRRTNALVPSPFVFGSALSGRSGSTSSTQSQAEQRQ